MRPGKKKTTGFGKNSAKSVGALFVALALGALLLTAAGYSPIRAYGAIVKGAVGSRSALINTLIQMVPLLFTGLSFAFASRAGLISLGMEGQMLTGAMAAAVAGAWELPLPPLIHILFAMTSGIMAGGLWGLLTGYLKVKFGANEFIVTIMLNYIAQFLTSYVTSGPLRDETSMISQTRLVCRSALLPKLIPGRGLTIALLLGIFCAVGVWFFMEKTRPGYETRAVGYSPVGAETAGIPIGAVTMRTMFISGAIAAMAGVSMVLGPNERFIDGFSPGYGFNGIAVAYLAGTSPLGIIPSAFVFGGLRAGSLVLNMTQRIQPEFSDMVQALVIIFVAMPILFTVRSKASKKEGGETVCMEKSM